MCVQNRRKSYLKNHFLSFKIDLYKETFTKVKFKTRGYGLHAQIMFNFNLHFKIFL